MKRTKLWQILIAAMLLTTLLAAAAQAAPGDLSDGNGDMEIYAGGGTDSSDDLIWAIQDDDVYEIDTDGTDALVWTIQDDDLVGPEGCSSEAGPGSGSTILRNADGEVLFTVKGRHLWYGAVDVPDEGSSGWETANSQRAYDIWQNQLYAGPKGKSDALITATAIIQEASPLRKLAIAALVEGECGSSGLDPRIPPQ